MGVNPRIEFLDDEYHSEATAEDPELLRYDRVRGAEALIDWLLAELPLPSHFEDRARDVSLAAAALEREMSRLAADPVQSVEVLPTIFYRNKAAYVVARVTAGGSVLPLVLALVQRPGGMVVDAVLMSRDEAGVVFGFTRSYFHVDAPQPAAVVRFLSSILGTKRRHELYTAIGFNRHGKSELYRTLRAELKGGQCRLEPPRRLGDNLLAQCQPADRRADVVFGDQDGIVHEVTQQPEHLVGDVGHGHAVADGVALDRGRLARLQACVKRWAPSRVRM